MRGIFGFSALVLLEAAGVDVVDMLGSLCKMRFMLEEVCESSLLIDRTCLLEVDP